MKETPVTLRGRSSVTKANTSENTFREACLLAISEKKNVTIGK